MNDFLPPQKRQQKFTYLVKGNPSIKDTIEFLGISHPEIVIYGYWIRAKDTQSQLIEVLNRFNLLSEICLFKRCLRCNGLIISVKDEVAKGDTEIALKRLEILNGLPLVELNQAVRDLSAQFVRRSNLPPKASDDAVHIAAATVHGLDYLLTWNCKHIANAQIQRKLAEISLDLGYELPIICTPYELLGDYNDVGR